MSPSAIPANPSLSEPPPATEILRDLPPEWLIVFGALLLAGLLLWVFGKRLLKPAFVLAGMCIGGGIGFAVAVALEVPVAEWIVALGGAALLGIFTWLAYRPAMGVCMAIIVGLASPAAVIGWAEFKGHHVISSDDGAAIADAADENGEPSERDLIIEMRELLRRMRESENLSNEARDMLHERWQARGEELGLFESEDGSPHSDSLPEGEGGTGVMLPPWREQFDLLVESIRAEFKARWEAADPGVRRSVVLSAASGAILGLLIGLSLPGVAASILTAMVGAGVALFSFWSIATSLQGGPPPWLPRTAGVWVIVWAAMSVIGIALQWTIPSKPDDKSGNGK
jgi:hypothetical protein